MCGQRKKKNVFPSFCAFMVSLLQCLLLLRLQNKREAEHDGRLIRWIGRQKWR
jgi:hypothetical protein